MIRATEHAVRSIVCAVPNLLKVSEADITRKMEKNGYPFIYFAYLNGTYTEPNRPGLYMLKIKSKSFGTPTNSGGAAAKDDTDESNS